LANNAQDDNAKNIINTTKKRRAQTLQDITNNPNQKHDIYRNTAINSLDRYRDKMEHTMTTKYNIHKHAYNIGDFVKIQIAKIDRGPGDRNSLPCKITRVLKDDMYQLVCKFGVLQNAFTASKIQPLGPQQFQELENPPMDQAVTLVEASRLQSAALGRDVTCNCKGNCLSGRCRCRKENVPCGSGCHPTNNACKRKS